MLEPSVWAIIPVRGGSKSIPCKNLQEVGGVPLIARAIRACRAADTVRRTIVSTDDDAIADIAHKEGAEVVFRPSQISGDEAKSEDALLHTIANFEARKEVLPEAIAFVQCTSPFVNAADIDGTVRALEKNRCNCAFAAARQHAFLWRQLSEGCGVGVNHNAATRLRRQDRDPEFLETGAVYVMQTEGFRAAKHRFFGKIAIYEMPHVRAIEIDEPDDLKRAQLLAPWLDGDSAIPMRSTHQTKIAAARSLISHGKKRFSAG